MGFRWEDPPEHLVTMLEEKKKLFEFLRHMKNMENAKPKIDWNSELTIASKHVHDVIISWDSEYPRTPSEAVATKPGFQWEGELPESYDVMKSKLKQRHAEELAKALGIKPWDTKVK